MSLSKKEQSFFNAAKAVSELSDHRVKLGCVIVSKHRIVSSGFNSNSKCHPVQAQLDSQHFGCSCIGKLHAETTALLPLLRQKVDLSKATLYVYRSHRDRSLAMARPCPRCMQLIRKAKISKIRYTTEDGYATEVLKEVQ